MSYVSPIQQKQSIADLLKDKPSNAPPSEKDVTAFSKALAPSLQLAETTVIELIDGGPGHVHKLDTTPAQEQAIVKRAEQIGSVSAPLCASSVSKALDGVFGIEGSIWPSTLGENAEHANCK